MLEERGTPAPESRLPQVHAREIVGVIEKITQTQQRLGDKSDDWVATVLFDETYAQRDGAIERLDNPSFVPKTTSEWVVSGPQIGVGTPFYQSCNTKCQTHRAFSDIDVTEIDDGFLPRSVYRPDNKNEFEAGIPKYNDKPATQFYRFSTRRFVATNTERTVPSVVLPPNVTHINVLLSLMFNSDLDVVTFAACTASLLSLIHI